MHSLYRKLTLLMLLTACYWPALQAQNQPNLQTAVPDSSDAVTMPPMLSTTAVPAYIRVFNPKVPTTDEAMVYLATPEQVQIATSYKDGFNRTIMSVAHGATTNSSGTLMNLVQPVDTRFSREQLGFPAYASAWATYELNMFTVQRNYYNGLYPDEYYTAASRTQVVSSSAVRGVKTMAPGKSQIGQNRGITTIKITNGASEVRIWDIDAGTGYPVSSGYYAAGQLFGERTTDTTGGETFVYSDKDGKVICKMIKQETVVSGPTVLPVYAITTYVYDEYGRLRFTLPPLASIAAVGGSINTGLADSLCFRYEYDDHGRPSGEHKPGEQGFTRIVYDKKDRAVMRQTPNEAVASTPQWEVTFYDNQNRVKATSLYNNSNNRSYWQSLLDSGAPGTTAADLAWHLSTAAGEIAYPAENAVSGNSMMSYTYYDDYRITDPDSIKWNTYGSQLMFTELVSTGTAEIPARSNRTQGMMTGGRVRILPAPGVSTAQTGAWREHAIFYDDKGRNIYNASFDMNGSTLVHAHFTGVQYDFTGRALVSKHRMYNANSTDGHTTHTEFSRNYYHEQTGQLMKTTHKNDNMAWTTSSMYTYDALGKVKRKVLGNYGEVQDFDYNIRGQLAGVNTEYTLTGNKQGQSRSFGEVLRYDYGFDQVRYDGKVAGMIWRGSNINRMYAYGYSYDYGGRLKGADFRNSEGTWTTFGMDYTVSNLTYDLNGNILTMKQKGPGSSTPTTIDYLSYTYKGNRLNRVEDTVTVNYGNGDFQNGNSSADEYAYDAAGNVTEDKNKGIVSVTYNPFNKPVVATMTGSKSIANSYDAGSGKVQEKITEPGKPTKVTDYLGNYVYENNVLQYLLTPEGRNVYNNDSNTFNEEYFVKDHLGNVRSIVDVHNYPVLSYLATYEVASANLENFFFDAIDGVRDDRPGATWDGDLKSARLNGDDAERRTGTSLILKVMSGDKVEMNVNNFYEGYDPGEDSPLSMEDMLESVIGTLSGGRGGSVIGESHNDKTITDAFNMPNYETFNEIVDGISDNEHPKAYLNYILFDEDLNIVPAGSGSFQSNGNGTWTQMGTTAPMEIRTNGYLAVYLDNRSVLSCGSCGDVFFDQLVVKFSKGVLKEESHYYPHGMPMGGIGSAAAGFEPNRRRYQSNEYITNIDLNWMDFHNRQYDPQLGRFLGVDPMAAATDMMSPYVAMNNDPVLNVDPLGLQSTTMSTPAAEALFASVGAYYEALAKAFQNDHGDAFFDALPQSWGETAEVAARNHFWGLVYTALQSVSGRVDIFKNGGGEWTANFITPIENGVNFKYDSKGDDKDGWKSTSLIRYQISAHYNYYEKSYREFFNGAELEVKYDASLKGLSDVNWIQSITVTRSGYKEKTFTDGAPFPFYWDLIYQNIKTNNNNTNAYFEDGPGRLVEMSDYSFDAELSLVGKNKNGNYVNIATFKWGYIVPAPNVVVPYFDATPVSPSPYQQTLINAAK